LGGERREGYSSKDMLGFSPKGKGRAGGKNKCCIKWEKKGATVTEEFSRKVAVE